MSRLEQMRFAVCHARNSACCTSGRVWRRLDAEEGTASPSDGSGATLHIYERILWLPQWASRRALFCEAEASRYRGTIC